MANKKTETKSKTEETKINNPKVKESASFEPTEEYITNVLKALGFRKYKSGNSYYYLPVAISPMTKITEKKAKELFKQE